MVNASLAYEILLYINSFYFGLFAMCELGTLVLKTVLLTEYKTTSKLNTDYGVLVLLFAVETARLVLGRRGSLSERDVPVMVSVALTVPSICGVLYLLIDQVQILKIEYIWCTLMFTLLLLEFVFACMFVVSACRGPSYD